MYNNNSSHKQAGFTLLELVAAMIIIAVIATLGFKNATKYSDQAYRIKAQDTLKTVSGGLDFYYLKYGAYPNLASFKSMVDANSPLVNDNIIPVNVPDKDPWGAPYEGVSSTETYSLKCLGSPKDKRAIIIEPGKILDNLNASKSSNSSNNGLEK